MKVENQAKNRLSALRRSVVWFLGSVAKVATTGFPVSDSLPKLWRRWRGPRPRCSRARRRGLWGSWRCSAAAGGSRSSRGVATSRDRAARDSPRPAAMSLPARRNATALGWDADAPRGLSQRVVESDVGWEDAFGASAAEEGGERQRKSGGNEGKQRETKAERRKQSAGLSPLM